MAETTKPPRYSDPQYQAAHDDTFSHPLTREIAFVLPPEVSQDDFDKAIAEFVEATDQESVFTGEALKDYVDPYEIPEAAGDRKVPSAAVWFVHPGTSDNSFSGGIVWSLLMTCTARIPSLSCRQSSKWPTNTRFRSGPSPGAKI